MADINIRSDSVDVAQIMRQIRARIREKRGVDYTEEEIRELAAVKLETFLDPRGVRSDLLDQFRQSRAALTPAPNFAFEDTTIYDSHRAPILRWLRNLLKPVVKLFFNVNPVIQALHIQSDLNSKRERLDGLQYEVMHNLVLELTKLGIEVKNLKMRVESMSSRLDFDERRARALEGVVVYRPGAAPPLQPPATSPGSDARPGHEGGDSSERRSRRRRRRGRRRPLDSREGGLAQGRPLDSREGGLAQGRPVDSREGGLAQGRPVDSREGGLAQGRPLDSREGGPAQGNRGEARPLPQANPAPGPAEAGHSAPSEKPPSGQPGDGGTSTE